MPLTTEISCFPVLKAQDIKMVSSRYVAQRSAYLHGICYGMFAYLDAALTILSLLLLSRCLLSQFTLLKSES